MDLIKEFTQYIKKENIIKEGEKLLLAVSGGPDSLTMLDLFYRISKDYNLKILVFHLNHKFREKAEKEAQFVRKFCQKKEIKVKIKNYDVPAYIEETGDSPEEAARNIRLDLLKKEAEKNNIKKVALGHNKNDLVETVFLNIFRGAGLKGLTGINPITNYKDIKLIHPLLNISRNKIKNYCEYRNLKPRTDPTNKQDQYTRNKIRLNIIPYIKEEINPKVVDKIARMTEVLREEDLYLQQKAESTVRDIITRKEKKQINLSLEALKKTPAVIRKRILRSLIYRLKKSPSDLYFQHFQEIEDLIFKEGSNKKLNLPGNIILKKTYNNFIIKKGEFKEGFTDYKYILDIPGTLQLPEGDVLKIRYLGQNENWEDYRTQSHIGIVDAEKIKLPLRIRNRRKGDKFQPLGMQGTKKIKDFLIDEKIENYARKRIPLIIDNEDRIVWVGGYRINEKFKVTRNTQKFLKMTLFKEKER